MNPPAQTPGGAAAQFFSWTVIMLILLAIGAAIVVAGMLYGNYLARQRHRAQDAAEERAEEAGIEPTPAPTPGDVAPAPELAKEPDPADRAVERRDEVEPAPSFPEERAAEPSSTPTTPAHPHPSHDASASRAPSLSQREREGAAKPRKGEGDPVSTETEPADIAPDTRTESEPASSPAVETAPAPTPEPAAPPLAGALALTTIKGLGPKVAALLAEQGITRVDQLAALSDADADALDAQLGTFAGRMTRDRWLDQAKLLASGDTAAYEAEFGKLG